MSRRSRSSGAAAAASAAIDDTAAAAPAAAAAAAADGPALTMAQLLAGCSFSDIKSVCHCLSRELNGQIRHMNEMVVPLTTVAESWVRRVGPKVADSAEGHAKIDHWRRMLRVCVQKKHELNILDGLLALVSAESASGQIDPERDWSSWLQENGGALEAKPENRNKLAENEARAIEAFNDKIRQVVPHLGGAAVAADPDEEVIDQSHLVDAAVALTCKLTQALLQDPVRNSACGHHYSREAIMSHLSTKQRRVSAIAAEPLRDDFTCTCPIAGCSQLVGPATLVADPAVERQVRELTRARARDAALGSDTASRSTARKKGTVKEEDLTQMQDDDDEPAAASSSEAPKRRASKRT